MKLRSAFVGLLLLATLAACDTNQTPTPQSTAISVSNPTSAPDTTQPTPAAQSTTQSNTQPTTAPVDTQPTTAPIATDTPVINPAMTTTPHVTGNNTRPPKGAPNFLFMPRRGGPGSLINITGGNFTPGKTVVIRIGVPQPIGEPLATAQVGDDGRWYALIKIPGTDPSGKDITTTDMQIVVMDENNQTIVSQPFPFTPKK